MVPVELQQGFSKVFYQCLDRCKTIFILQNVMNLIETKGDIMGYNEQWLFSMESYLKYSKLP